MRLGRKLAEGFAVDHEADQARIESPAPAADPVAAAPDAVGAVLPVRGEPAHSGPRAGD